MNSWELPYTLLLLSPMIATSLSLSYFLLQTGVNDLLTGKEVLGKTKKNYVFIIILAGYIISNLVLMTQLQKAVIYDGSYTILYIIGLLANILCTWLMTNWFAKSKILTVTGPSTGGMK